MSDSRRRFAFRPLAVAIVAATSAVMLWLGFWQLDRADQKRQLLAEYAAEREAVPLATLAAEAGRYLRVWVEGEYDAGRQVLLDGIKHNRQAGYQVLTPLRQADGALVMVNRGWLPLNGERDALVAPAAPTGRVRIEGRVAPFFQAGMRLGEGNEAEAARWPRLAVYPGPDEVSGWLGEPVAAQQLLLAADMPGGYLRDWTPAELPPSRHVGYAMQWFAFTAILIGGCLIASRVPRETSTSETDRT